jgi:hypothetical protein
MQSPSPFDVLRVPPHASGDAVRAAFLAMAKRYHPTRFAREPAEVVDLATEIFLAIRKAYGLLNDDAKLRSWRERTMAVLATPAAPATQPPTRTPPTEPPSARVPATQPPTTRAPATQPPAAAAAPATQPPMAPRPPATQPPMAPRPPATQPPMAPRPPATQPPVAPRPSTSQPPVVAPRATGARSQSVPVVPPPVTLRPPGTSRPRPPTPAQGVATRDVHAMLDLVRTRGARTEQANTHIALGRYTEAREALLQLVSEEPQNRKLRQRLHLATGLEHRAAQRYDDAVRELERAITFDPTSADVHEALRVTREQRDAARGLFGKLFGR